MGRGGARKGAGRPKGKETTRIRIPKEMVAYLRGGEEGMEIVDVKEIEMSYLNIPAALQKVPAGFPVPTGDGGGESMSLDEILISRPATTFLMRVKGDSMKDVGIIDGDWLIVDRSIEPVDGKIVVAHTSTGGLTVKRLRMDKEGHGWLMPENPAYPPILLREEDGTSIWGVVKARAGDVS